MFRWQHVGAKFWYPILWIPISSRLYWLTWTVPTLFYEGRGLGLEWGRLLITFRETT